MDISITTRHFDIDEKTRAYLNEKLARLEKYFSRIFSAKAIFTKEGYRYIAEVEFLGKGMQLVAKEEAEDMHSAIDLAVHKLEKQLLRYRDKKKEHKGKKFKAKEKQAMLDQLNEEIRNS